MNNDINLLALLIGFAFFIVGCILLGRFLKKKKSVSSKYIRIVEGTIVELDYHSNSSDSGSSYTYFPIYELNLNGNKIRYESKYACVKDSIGEKRLLYYDEYNGMIFEPESMKKDLFCGFLCLLLGVVTIFSILF